MTQDEICAVSCFSNEMVGIRDRLKPIIIGEIERSHCLAGSAVAYGGTPGKRKTTLKDAVAIAKLCCQIIDREVNKIDRLE